MRILIVDDDAVTAELLRAVIMHEWPQLDITTAHSGNEAWRLLQKRRYEVVLSDIDMPDGDGFGLLEKIRALSRSVSVVLMSGGHAEAKARMAGAAAFLSKPIMPETLRATVTALSARFPEQT